MTARGGLRGRSSIGYDVPVSNANGGHVRTPFRASSYLLQVSDGGAAPAEEKTRQPALIALV